MIDPWRAYTDFSTPLTMYEVRTKEKDMPFFFPLLRWHGRPWLSMRASYAGEERGSVQAWLASLIQHERPAVLAVQGNRI